MRIKSAVDKAKSNVATDKNEPSKEQSDNNAITYTNTKIVSVNKENLIGNRIITLDDDDPRASSFHILRTKILKELRIHSWNSVAISAPTPGAGKSQIAINIHFKPEVIKNRFGNGAEFGVNITYFFES